MARLETVTEQQPWAEGEAEVSGQIAERLLIVNVFLVFFNLIPAFPMDGGRVLRALLALRLEYVRATRIAASVGKTLAVGFGLLGLFGNPFLILIAFFVWFGAGQEADLVRTKAALGDVLVGRVMITDYRTVAPWDTLGRAADLTLAGSQKDFPVVDGERLVGMLTQRRLIAALEAHGRDLAVAAVMEREFHLADLTERIEAVFQRLQECACRTIPVLGGGRLAGLVTRDNVGEFLSIRAALRE